MLHVILDYLRRKRALRARMADFERNGMHASWARVMPKSRWQ